MPVTRKRLGGATALSTAVALSLLAAPAAGAAPSDHSQAGTNSAASECSGDWHYGGYYFGYYLGNVIVPATDQVTDAGLEAQCQLDLWHNLMPDDVRHPGPIDGVFGEQSQAAMSDAQRWVNEYGEGDPDGGDLDVDGLPGPQSWGPLRHPPLDD